MSYAVKEIYYTLQGEGAQAGRAAVFLRFTGCNLWSGFEKDRATAACNFCDTDFVGTDGAGGGKFNSPADLAAAVNSHWPASLTPGQTNPAKKLVVCTGGEPLLQLDSELIRALHDLHFEVAVETNGTRLAPPFIDWICVSPKPNSKLLQNTGHEIKLVYPQPTLPPDQFAHLQFHHFFLQPLDGPDHHANIEKTIQYCLQNPQWRLSLQTHKLVGLK